MARASDDAELNAASIEWCQRVEVADTLEAMALEWTLPVAAADQLEEMGDVTAAFALPHAAIAMDTARHLRGFVSNADEEFGDA